MFFSQNNGLVAGIQYFQCEPMYGLFARIEKVSIVDEPARAIDAPLFIKREPSDGNGGEEELQQRIDQLEKEHAENEARNSAKLVAATESEVKAAAAHTRSIKVLSDQIEVLTTQSEAARGEAAAAKSEVEAGKQ